MTDDERLGLDDSQALAEAEHWFDAVLNDPDNDLHWDEAAGGAIERGRWLAARVRALEADNRVLWDEVERYRKMLTRGEL